MTAQIIPLPVSGAGFKIDSSTHGGVPGAWSVSGGPCHQGLAGGMTVAQVDSGAISATILPGRGMGIWRAEGAGQALGWKSPVRSGPVHPGLVNAHRRGGIGWLDGFDELLCRCGLAANGPPGKDDNGGEITLHGRIANIPAWKLEAIVETGPRPRIGLRGVVDECSLFDSCLRLTTTYFIEPGSLVLRIEDKVENLGARPAEFQLLYHLNIGFPFLGEGSRAHVRFAEMAPQTPRAAEGVSSWQTYGPPETGFAEQVYLFQPRGDENGQGLAVLEKADGNAAIVVRFPVASLPFFTLWKNSGALEEGYVTGLEPATGFPNFKAFERSRGRVPVLDQGASWNASWTIELVSEAANVKAAIAECGIHGTVHGLPARGFSPQGG